MIKFRNIFAKCSTEMFHGIPSSPCRSREEVRAGGVGVRRAAAVDAAEAQCRDGSIGEAAPGEGLERCFTPAVAAQAVELQRVVAREQVGDGVQVDGGGHHDPSVRSMRAQGVSLARASASPDVTL